MEKTQELMMNRIFNLERAQQKAPRPPDPKSDSEACQGLKNDQK
jgi:hypothetical protein